MKCDNGADPLRRFPSWLGFVVVAAYCLLYLAPLGLRPLFVPDESRYAAIAREMTAGGDWSRLRQAGLPYYEKPPLGYWLTAASLSVFGKSGFAVRLPSALSALAGGLAIFLFTRRRRDGRHGLAAAVIFLSSAQVFGMGTFAVLDAMFSFFVTLSMLFLYEGETSPGRLRRILLVLAGVFCGLAFLTKGFVAVVIPALTVLVWFAWEGRFRRAFSMWLLPVAAALLTVLPFVLVVGKANPGFWTYFFWVEHVQRFLEPGGGQHPEPLWYFVPVLAVGFLPWSFFLPATAVSVRRMSGDGVTRFCLSWFATSFVFFSVCGGKLPTYLLPCFAPLAIMTGDALFAPGRERLLRRCALAAAAIVVLAIGVFLVWLLTSDHRFLREDLLGDARTLVLGASLLVFAFCLYRAAGRFTCPAGRMRALGLTALGLGTVAAASILVLPPAVENRRSPGRLLDEVAALTPPDAFLLADRITLPAVCWRFDRDDVAFFGGRGELEASLELEPSPGRYVDTASEAGALLAARLRRGHPAVVFLTVANYRKLMRDVPWLVAEEERRLLRFVWALYLPENNTKGEVAGHPQFSGSPHL